MFDFDKNSKGKKKPRSLYMFLDTRLCARWPDYDCKVLLCIFYVYKKKKKIPVKIILLIVYVANLNRSFNESLCNILTNKNMQSLHLNCIQ